MGLLNAVGVNNGFTDFLAGHRGALMDFGAGLAVGPTPQQGVALGTRGLATGGARDDAYATSQKAEKDRVDAINKTKAFLTSNPALSDLVPLVDAGQGGAALTEAFHRLDAKAAPPADPTETYQGRMQAGQEQGLSGTDLSTYALTGKLPAGAQDNPPTLTSIYDANGREQKGYMKGDQFVPVGSPKAAIERPEYTNTQALAAGYADRMTQADKILDNPALSAAQTDLTQKTLSGVPVVGNMMNSPEFQQADQAQRDFINAILRRESGAAIAQSEFDSARKQYFPQPGDSKEVLAQKKQNRLNAIHGVARSAGPAYQQSDASSAGDLSGLSDDELLKQLNN